MDNFGSIFSNTTNMGNEGRNIRYQWERKKSDGSSVSDKFSSSFIYHIYPFNTWKMATAKVVWYLFNLLGWPSAIYLLYASCIGFFKGILGDIKFVEIGEPFKTVVLILGLIFLVVKILILLEYY